MRIPTSQRWKRQRQRCPAYVAVSVASIASVVWSLCLLRHVESSLSETRTTTSHLIQGHYLSGRHETATTTPTSLTSSCQLLLIRGGSSTSASSCSLSSLSSSRIPAASSTSTPSSTTTGDDDATTNLMMIRVAYQGEPGAYSEKATRELLGDKVIAVGRPNFEACFRAVASMECEYACLPVENSLGGSIHENYDLMLRYDLVIVAEHEFRVKHCLLVKPGVQRDQIKYAISHPQALAQCDNYLRGLGITPIPTYDTAGSAKMLAEASPQLPAECTPDNTAAIASELACRTYGLHCLAEGIEDDDTNFTRFLLLARKGVAEFIHKHVPAKTSVVFTLPNTPGCLYKALACFALRDIDSSKIESRPTSASLLNFLKFKSSQQHHSGRKSRSQADLPRFRYCFYLDFLANQLDETAQNALAHLREQSDFMRILGSYPQKSQLVGPVAQQVERLKQLAPLSDPSAVSWTTLPSEEQDSQPLHIGVLGFDQFGQFLSQRLAMKHHVSCLDKVDRSKTAQKLGVEYFSNFEVSKFLAPLDVLVIAVPLVEFEDIVNSLPASELRGKLVVETCVLNAHPKAVLLRAFGDFPDIDLVSSHPMFGPVLFAGDESKSSFNGNSDAASWDGRPFVYEKVRVSDMARFQTFLQVFEAARCRLIEMTAEQHDDSIADAEFVTHLTGRLLVDKQLLPPTPVVSKEYAALADVADMTSGDSFDLFFGMYKFHDRAKLHITKLRDNLATLEKQLAAKEAYLSASAELHTRDRQRLLEEARMLLKEVARNGGLFQPEPDHRNDHSAVSHGGATNIDTNNAKSNEDTAATVSSTASESNSDTSKSIGKSNNNKK